MRGVPIARPAKFQFVINFVRIKPVGATNRRTDQCGRKTVNISNCGLRISGRREWEQDGSGSVIAPEGT
jgi:hypothetical protein